MKFKINLDTMRDIKKFVDITTKIPYDVFLEDDRGCKCSAQSLMMTAVASMEWNNLYCTCEHDIYTKIVDFIVE